MTYPAALETMPSPLYWSLVGVEMANPLFRQKNIIGVSRVEDIFKPAWKSPGTTNVKERDRGEERKWRKEEGMNERGNEGERGKKQWNGKGSGREIKERK